MGPGLAKDHLRGEVAIGSVWLNPLTFVVSVRNFAWTGPDGRTLARFDRFRVNADPVGGLFHGEWRVREISLLRGFADVRIDEDGQLNFSSALVEKESSETEPEPEGDKEAFALPSAWLGELAVEDLAVQVTDLSGARPFSKTLQPIRFRLENLRTGPEAENRYLFSARTEAKEEIRLEGVVRMEPLRVSGELTAEALKLTDYSLFTEVAAGVRLQDGLLGLRIPFTAHLLGNPLRAEISGARFELQGLRATLQGRRDADLSLRETLVEDIGLDFSLPEKEPLSLRTTARLHMEDFRAQMAGEDQPFASFAGFRLEDLEVAMTPLSVRSGEIVWSRPDFTLRRDAEGELTVLQLLPAVEETEDVVEEAEDVAESVEEVATPPAEVETETAADSPMDLRIASFRLEEGRFHFRDASVTPEADVLVHPLQLELAPLTLDPETATKLRLDATLLGQGTLGLEGEMRLADLEKATSALLTLEDVPMTSFSPYTVMALGQPVEEGKLGIDVDVSIKEQELDAENVVRMDRIRFGPVVSGFDGKTYPLGTAIAVMENGKGLIELDVPVRGSLADPSFDPTKVVANVFRNLFLKAVTAPFNLAVNMTGGMLSGLTSFASGGGEELADYSSVSFAPGTREPAAEAAETLEVVAGMLGSRPKLLLSLVGSFAPEEDRDALREIRFEEQLAKFSGDSRTAKIRRAYRKEVGGPSSNGTEIEPGRSDGEASAKTPEQPESAGKPEPSADEPEPSADESASSGKAAAPKSGDNGEGFYLEEDSSTGSGRQLRSFYLSSSRRIPIMRRMTRAEKPEQTAATETEPEETAAEETESEETAAEETAPEEGAAVETASAEATEASTAQGGSDADGASQAASEPTVAEMEEQLRGRWLDSEPDLEKLATDRALNIRDALIDKHGVDVERITVSETVESSAAKVRFSIESTVVPQKND